jgi:hypothetical protein
MAILKGNYNSSNNTYIQVDDDAKQWSLLKATPEQYQSTSGNLQFTEQGIETLKINAGFSNITGLANFSDAKNQDLFGPNPLEGIKNQRNEALALYGNSLTGAERENQIINQPGTALSALLSSNTSENLEQDSNFSVEQPSSSFSLPNASSGYTSSEYARAVGGTTKGAVLKYPIDMDLAIQDHFAITAATYQPANLPTVAEGNQSVQFLRTKNTALGKTILLPMPNEIVDRNSVSWGKGEIGSVTGSLFGQISNRLISDADNPLEGVEQKNIMEKLGELSSSTGQFFTDIGEAAGQVASQPFVRRKFLLDAAASAASLLQVNVDVGQILQRRGIVENPNLELLFNAPDLRTFGFQFAFAPRNKQESIIVRSIIREFKQTMAVKRGAVLGGATTNEGSNLLLGVPNVYRLQYRRGSTTNEEIKGLNKFKTCALTDFGVNYTQGRWAAYAADSQPVRVIVTMNFAEIAPIYADDYENNNFESDDVAF